MPPFEWFDVPMLIGVVADTHRTSRNPKPLPDQLLTGLEGCDLIVHLGDVNAGWVTGELERIAPLHAIAGNNDESHLRETLPLERILRFGGYQVGMVHGHTGNGTAKQNAFQAMTGRVDCVLFGHSHRAAVFERDGLLMVNPGSPTQRRFAPRHTFARLTVTDRIEPEIVELD